MKKQVAAAITQKRGIGTGNIESKILMVRGCRVMLDADLAAIYQVGTKRLNEQVKRNKSRFPEDFMFQLTGEEAENLPKLMRSQIATASKRNVRYSPYVFTEHGAVMLASVLQSRVAVEASILVVRAFVRLHTLLAAHKELARKVEDMERRYDKRFHAVFEAIRELMKPLPETDSGKEPFGFQAGEKNEVVNCDLKAGAEDIYWPVFSVGRSVCAIVLMSKNFW